MIVHLINRTISDGPQKDAVRDRAAVDDLRLPEVRRRSNELPQEQHDDFKHTLGPFRQRAADLTPEEPRQMDGLYAHAPARKTADTVREELTTILATARSHADGLRGIHVWNAQGARRGLRCFAGLLQLLERRLDRIANYFQGDQTSGFVEGLQHKRKVLKRRCYGLGTIGRLFQRLTLDIEGYRRFSLWSTTTHEIWALSRQSLKTLRSPTAGPEGSQWERVVQVARHAAR